MKLALQLVADVTRGGAPGSSALQVCQEMIEGIGQLDKVKWNNERHQFFYLGRWMGPVRFTIGALLEVLHRKKYAARVAFVRTADAGSQFPSGPAEESREAAQEKGSRMNGSQMREQRSVEGSTTSTGPSTVLLDDLGDLSQLDLCNASSLPQVWLLRPGSHVGTL